MKIKRISIIIFTVLFVSLTAISFFAYDKSSNVDIICEEGSYAYKYAKKHNIEYKTIADSERNLGLLNLDDFEYNDDGEIVSYSGDSEIIAIPEKIDDVSIISVKKDAFKDADRLKEIYISKTLLWFAPVKLKGITVKVPEDSIVNDLTKWSESNKINLKNGVYEGAEIAVSNPDDYEYTLGGTIVSYTGTDSIIKIPTIIGGTKITSVDKDAFLTAKRVTTIYFPDTVEEFYPTPLKGVKVYCSKDCPARKFAKIIKSKADISIGSVSADTATTYHEDYEYTEDGQIIAYTGVDKTIVVPEVIAGTTIRSISKKAFEKAPNLENIYLPESIVAFWPENLDDVNVYVPQNALLNNVADYKGNDFETFPDSYYVNFYSAHIPYTYNEISKNKIEIMEYTDENETIIIPQNIDGKEVTAISVDALSAGADAILIPGTVDKINTKLYTARYDAAFYLGILTALIGFALAVAGVLKLDIETKEKTFMRIPVIRIAYAVSVLSVLLSAAYMFVLPRYVNTPVWLGAVFIVLIAALGVTSFFKATTAAEMVEETEKKVKTNTYFIRSLTSDAEALMSSNLSSEMKAEAKIIYEALRYSDPMSDEKLLDAEVEIEHYYKQFEEAVTSNDIETAKSIGDKLKLSIEKRNKKCKLLK